MKGSWQKQHQQRPSAGVTKQLIKEAVRCYHHRDEHMQCVHIAVQL